jgi:predicted kinase
MSWELKGVEDGSFWQQLLDEGENWWCEMDGCPQDPVFHAEGDVLTHVGLVCQELSKLEEYQGLIAPDRQILAWAAALHDVAKPACTITEPDGRITSPGHAARGALVARRLLWQRDCPFHIREEICGLVHYHMKVFWALEQDDPARLVRKISLRCRPKLLALLAQADALGRDCPDTRDLLQKVELFRLLGQEHDCYEHPARFASDLSRLQYFQGGWHNPEIAPFEDFRCEVILLSGLPGSGKDTWIREQAPPWPVISLDAIRQELKMPPTGNQGKVINLARDRAREYLRARQNFIWNATNISPLIRRRCLSLVMEYGARVFIVYLEQPLKTLEERNRDRNAAVPWKAIEKMLRKWDPPLPTEAHRVLYPGQ